MQLTEYMKQIEPPHLYCRCPTFYGQPINLHKLFNAVQQHGGYDTVSAHCASCLQSVTGLTACPLPCSKILTL
jgi:ARID/BRIGHT DNA binding domain